MLFLNFLPIFVHRNQIMNQIGHKSIYLDVVDSTNNYVANLIKEGKIEHGTVILADEQTNGRGQRGTIWQTQPGMNLIFSLYVEFDDLPIEKQEAIHHWISLSVCALLQKMGIQAMIKWPNDILTENGKMAGILIENTLSNRNVKHSIIGIGMNVNQIDFHDVRATSIRLETGIVSNIREIAFILINELNHQWNDLVNHNFSGLKSRYLSRLWGMNQEVRFLRNEQIEKGFILGTNEMGALEVKTANGIECFDIKEVKFIVEGE
jgi:BirA family biotin operon repressor/biotin-[acetyl-CoA-carboxylase] ligase